MRILIFILLIFIAGCIGDKKIPRGIIPQNEMRKIMWDNAIDLYRFPDGYLPEESTLTEGTAASVTL